MGHVYTDLVVKGRKGELSLPGVLVDTGATYTVLPEEIIEEVGAWGPISEIELEPGNGTRVKARAYGVTIRVEDAESPAIVVTFKGARTVIGIETLESLGLKPDPLTGKLEFTRPKGIAYFYTSH